MGGGIAPPALTLRLPCLTSGELTGELLHLEDHPLRLLVAVLVMSGPQRRSPPSWVRAQRRTSEAAHSSPLPRRPTGSGKPGWWRSWRARS